MTFKEMDINLSSRQLIINVPEFFWSNQWLISFGSLCVTGRPASQSRPWVCQTTALCFVLLVPGFSTASYLKVHIKTHHGSPLPPSATMHTFPEPRGELQVHNGNPYHMGRQCSVEGKQPPAPSQTFMFLAFICSAAFLFFFFFFGETCCCISVYVL